MILKFFEIGKINLNKNKIILFYGKNEGLKNENTKALLKDSKNIINFEEKLIWMRGMVNRTHRQKLTFDLINLKISIVNLCWFRIRFCFEFGENIRFVC